MIYLFVDRKYKKRSNKIITIYIVRFLVSIRIFIYRIIFTFLWERPRCTCIKPTFSVHILRDLDSALYYPVTMRDWTDVGLMLVRRRRRRPNFGPTSAQCLMVTVCHFGGRYKLFSSLPFRHCLSTATRKCSVMWAVTVAALDNKRQGGRPPWSNASHWCPIIGGRSMF